MGDGNFRPPQNLHPLTDHQKNSYRWLRRRPLRLCQIWCKSFDGRLLGKWVKYNEFFFIYTFFSWTHLQVRPVGGFSRLMAQTTRTRVRMCFLGVSLTLLPILGVKSPENPNFGGVNRCFQAKRAKYWKFHVIETTASISTKFCKTIETIKRSSWVDPIGAQQIQDGGGRHLEKKWRYLRTVWPIFTKFGTLMQNGSLRPLKNLNFTNRRWRTAAILKPLHHPISATFWLTMIKYGTVIHAGPQSLA